VRKTVAVSNTSRAGLAVAGLSLGTSLNPLNSSMIAVALVVLREDFRLDVAMVTWVVNRSGIWRRSVSGKWRVFVRGTFSGRSWNPL
jgi:hypothetical protein